MALLAALLLASMPVRPPGELRQLIGRAHGKPLVLHFWGTWCSACLEEFPRLGPRLKKLASEGAAVELISIDRPQDGEKAERMLSDFGLATLPATLVDAPDPDPVIALVGAPKWDGTLPATFVFDANGKLVRSFIGRITDLSALTAATRPAK